MRLLFTASGWDDYQFWLKNNCRGLERVNAVIEDARRNPFIGLGKPEPLKGDLSGWWSRRITGEHRFVYRVEGKPGYDQRIVIVACRLHYGR